VNFISYPCISLLTLLEKFQNNISLDYCILKYLSSSLLLNFLAANQHVQKL